MNKTDKKQILVIEDETHIAEGLKLNLTLQGYEVTIAKDGVSALQIFKEIQPDLVVLDIMLPAISGFSVLQNIRLENEQIPVMILSAKGAPDDRIKGLSLGADDYLAKPFNLEEFLLRVDRLLTRVSWIQNKNGQIVDSTDSTQRVYSFGNNSINFETSVAYCATGEINLTEQELKLLKLFITNKRKPLSRSRLLEIGWGYTSLTSTRTIDNFIVRLRKYFEENPKKPVFFKSIRSIGYMFDHD